jgi:hypothetical protein
MLIKSFIKIIPFLFITINAFSQTAKLSNGNKTKIISTNNVLKIYSQKGDNKVNNCPECYQIEGKFIKLTNDSLYLLANNLSTNINIGNWNQLEYSSTDYKNPITISLGDITYLKKYKNSTKSNLNLLGIGTILLFTGGITVLNNLWVHKESRPNIWKAGGIQIGLGTVLLLSSTKKKYHFKDNNKPWKLE